MSGKRMGRTIGIVAALAAVAVVGVVVGTAGGKTSSITLKSHSATGVGTALVAPNSHTLYKLVPETKKHLLCTSSACLAFWKPLTVASKSTTVKLPSGASGKVTFLKRGSRFQVMLAGHPLYTFYLDKKAGDGFGQKVKSFNGQWFAITVKKKGATTPSGTTTAPANGYGTGGY